MANKQAFSEALSKHFGSLSSMCPLCRVHGKHHPEFYKVHKPTPSLIKQRSRGRSCPVPEEFIELREATSSYTVPDDVAKVTSGLPYAKRAR